MTGDSRWCGGRFLTVTALALSACTAPNGSQASKARDASTVTNSIGMQLVVIPAGEFMMGAEEAPKDTLRALPYCDPELLAQESPRHKVRISKSFYMGRCEVTLAQFLLFRDDAHYTVDAEREGQSMTGYDDKGQLIESTAFRPWAPGWHVEPDHPAGYISWNDATAFCAWLSKKEGKHYRLPTEAEWEYACRAGTSTRYHCGNDPEELVHYANTPDADRALLYPRGQTDTYDENGNKTGKRIPYPFLKGHDGYAWTAPVGKFLPNQFGLYDMHGNSWEWCSDWFDENYYAVSPAVDPPGPPTGTIRVSRGGGFDNGPETLRCARRDGGTPESKDCHDGFRVVCER
jgi:formylglycine-generating enzyme required for sulfatase activity